MSDPEQPRRKPMFRIPTPAEVESRQKEVQQSAANVAFKPSIASSSNSASNPNRSQLTLSAVVAPTTQRPQPRPTQSAPAPAPAPAPRQSFGEQFAFIKETPHYAQGRELVAAQRAKKHVAGPSSASGASNTSVQQNNANSTLQRSRSSNSVLVNKCQVVQHCSQLYGFPGCPVMLICGYQEGNSVLSHIRNVPWEYGDIIADYQVGQTSCALFLRSVSQ